ncbi:hypothetical protein JQ580_32045 [Bradyrhizobium japonicum]|uniref:hypothetical protein n=1 Tax=Bradyrhizobium japonicum TaxID=375 RepID=UPI001BAAABB3|nr:hypothetical protein [Bradyrhizobium japonicum]MBR0995353.1 hypothetical protein [Bradyrhizobium japonicum]
MSIPFDEQPQQLRNDPPWFVRHEPPATKRRGRPRNNPALGDFTLEQVDRIYPWLCRRLKVRHVAKRRTADHKAISEYAYGLLTRWAGKRFPNIDWTTLRNKHTLWKRGHPHRGEYNTDSEDFDAEIERHFPPIARGDGGISVNEFRRSSCEKLSGALPQKNPIPEGNYADRTTIN